MLRIFQESLPGVKADHLAVGLSSASAVSRETSGYEGAELGSGAANPHTRLDSRTAAPRGTKNKSQDFRTADDRQPSSIDRDLIRPSALRSRLILVVDRGEPVRRWWEPLTKCHSSQSWARGGTAFQSPMVQ